MSIKGIIRHYFSWFYRPITKRIANFKYTKDASRLDNLSDSLDAPGRVYYLGITAHSNLGDMAQLYCITKWIKENYAGYELIMFESDTVVWESGIFLKKFKKVYRPIDIIIFQSGYTTTDLGGNHEYMHRLIVDNMPEANILMMPQTIYFKSDFNKKRCSDSIDKAQNMLFLARDFMSEKFASEMFPHVTVRAFPDIVTSLIGTLNFNNKRSGICVCCRNDKEKYYTDEELMTLTRRLEEKEPVKRTDTSIKESYKIIRKDLKYYIEKEIEKYSHYKVVITDRYHGTIFSIVAGTPVVIIKTTDHKVTTGADWFKGVYDNIVCVANDLEDAYVKALEFIEKEQKHEMKPYFKVNYYDKLKGLFEEVTDSKC
jgi:exopolysaccharide biosynthesis predicted pyruvyltransferase EpsI